MNWFYIDESIQDGDRRQGPLALEDLQALKAEGKIGDATLVWHKGLSGWISYGEALAGEKEKSKEQVEQELQKTVEAILRERVAEMSQKTYAGFFVRGMAIFIDWFLIGILWEFGAQILHKLSVIDINSIASAMGTFAEKYSADPFSASLSSEFMDIPGVTELFILWFAIQTVYFVCFNGFFSATPGKHLFRLRIERADGSPLRFSGAFIRYVFGLLTQATMIFYGIGYILALIDPQKRALHDFLAKTRVVRLPGKLFKIKKAPSKD